MNEPVEMTKKFYVDSDAMIGYVNREICRTKFTYQLREREMDDFFTFCKLKGRIILFSPKIFKEIEKVIGLTQQDIEDIFLKDCKLNYEIKPITEDIIKKARKFRQLGVHRGDDVHAAFAHTYSACLVTYNKRHYEPVENMIDVRYPSEIY